MKRFSLKGMASLWSRNLGLFAAVTFANRFGQGLFGGVRTNFFVETLGLTGGQVLWLEGVREIPGLALIFIAALMMRLPLARRASIALVIMATGFMLYVTINSYSALLVLAVVASLGNHIWMPLSPALAMSLASKEHSGRVLGLLSSIGSMAAILGMGAVSLSSRLFQDMPLGTYYLAGSSFILLAALLLFRLPTDIGASAIKQPRMLLKRRYWLFYVLTFFQGSRKEVLGTFVSLVLVQNFGLRVWQLSTLLMVSSVVNLLMAPYIGHLVDRLGERNTLTASYALLALCCLGYATIRSVWLLIPLMLVVKLLILFGMGLNTYVNRMAPPEELTPTLSAGISINHVTSVAMPLVAGAVLPLVGYEGVFAGTAVLLLLSVPFAWSMRVAKVAPVAQVGVATAD